MTKSVALVLVLLGVTAAVDVDLDPVDLDPIVVRLAPPLLITEARRAVSSQVGGNMLWNARTGERFVMKGMTFGYLRARQAVSASTETARCPQLHSAGPCGRASPVIWQLHSPRFGRVNLEAGPPEYRKPQRKQAGGMPRRQSSNAVHVPAVRIRASEGQMSVGSACNLVFGAPRRSVSFAVCVRQSVVNTIRLYETVPTTTGWPAPPGSPAGYTATYDKVMSFLATNGM